VSELTIGLSPPSRFVLHVPPEISRQLIIFSRKKISFQVFYFSSLASWREPFSTQKDFFLAKAQRR